MRAPTDNLNQLHARCADVLASDFRLWRSSAIETLMLSVSLAAPFPLAEILQAARQGGKLRLLHAAADTAEFQEALSILTRRTFMAVNSPESPPADKPANELLGLEGDRLFTLGRMRAALLCYGVGALSATREDDAARWAETSVARCLARGWAVNGPFVELHRQRVPELFRFNV